MDLSTTRIGPFSLYTIETGRFRLDGGAMFGVVPKTLWSRQIEADAKNRIPMAMRCLLIESHATGRLYLVDNGAGTKFDAKFREIYQVDHAHSNLADSLAFHGFDAEEVTDLIFTHLHFDHCGGTTYYDGDGAIRHTFPNARYHVTGAHWETAVHPNAREKASFLKDNIEPVGAWDKLHLVDDPEEHEYEKGLRALAVNGHTIGQQLPVIEAEGTTIVFAADLLPTSAHVPLPWIMGYDMRPVVTLEEKEEILDRAARDNWYLFMEHDASDEVITIDKKEHRFSVRSRLRLEEIG